MGKTRVPKRKFLVKHMRRFSQYSNSASWINWYARVAVYKAVRTSKMLKEYQDTNIRLLDLGCGIGLTLSIVSQVFPNSVGCDIDRDAIKATKAILKEVGVKIPVILYDGKLLPFKDNSFDIVISIEVIEHAENPDLMLKEIRRILKPDGILHITTANKWWPREPHFKLFLLSYLPKNFADLYVRLSGKGEDYGGIKLPSYGKFRSMVDKYFIIEDITLHMIKNFEKYAFDKERGLKVILVGRLLQLLDRFETIPVFKYFPNVVKWILTRVSLGWLFIGRPRKKRLTR